MRRWLENVREELERADTRAAGGSVGSSLLRNQCNLLVLFWSPSWLMDCHPGSSTPFVCVFKFPLKQPSPLGVYLAKQIDDLYNQSASGVHVDGPSLLRIYMCAVQHQGSNVTLIKAKS